MKTKKLINRIAMTIIGICIFQSSFCQENYLPGYIINLTGDTLHGFIDYRNWNRNPKIIFFKEKSNGHKAKYTPLDIKAFGVRDEIYESAKVEVEESSDNTSELQSNNELDIQVDTVFLQTMIKGSKSLYCYKNENEKEQFYIKQGSGYELLIYKKYISDHEGKEIITENGRYLSQLSNYLEDCQEIPSKLADTKYNKKSLENLFRFYYNYTQTEIKFQKKTEKFSTEFGVFAGMSSTSLKFRSSFVPYLVNANYNQSVNFSSGLSLNIIIPRNQGKWSIYNELIYTSYKVNGLYNGNDNLTNYKAYSTFGYSYLKMNNMIRFKYPIGGAFVFLNAGMSNGIAISETNHLKRVWPSINVDEGKAIDDTRKYEQGLILGLGGKFKKYSFEIRYENGNGMSSITSLNSETNRYFFLLGYTF